MVFGLNKMSGPVEKLSFEGMDFKFMAAYNQYVAKFENAEEERQVELNDLISKLHSNEIKYDEFYANLAGDSNDRYRFHRSKIESSRKFAYRANERKVNRIKRHK
jgi:hypothetical protein